MKFSDGLKSLLSDLINTRSASNANEIESKRIQPHELRAIFKTGLGNKIIRIKNGYALKSPFLFESEEEKEFYRKVIKRPVKKAGSFMLGFGRGIVVINEAGADLSTPMVKAPGRYKLDVFSGDMVSAANASSDLRNKRYYKPELYNVRGFDFHHSRVVDFSYVEPPEYDAPEYQYGGVSEFQLIYQQLVNDAVIERASASIIEKSSTLFYKVKNFKDNLRAKKEGDLKSFISLTETARSIYGAGIIDSEDDVVNIDQKLNNLSETDQISLRRVAMVSNIPFPILIGESPKGMNSSGDVEKLVFNEMIEILKEDFYLDPVNELLEKLGHKPVTLAENQNTTPIEKVDYESKALDNAKKLWEMGEDYGEYLEKRGIVQKETDYQSVFNGD